MRNLAGSRQFFDIYNDSGDIVRGELRHISSLRESPVVIFCHSFMAFKDWGFFPYVAERLVEKNFVALTLNFSYNGVAVNGDKITEFDRFAENTFSKEIEDLKGIIDAVWEGRIGGGIIDRAKIVLMGHSRGGGISVLQTSQDIRIRALISWSSIGKFDRWTEHQKRLWRAQGYLPLSKDAAVSPLRLGVRLLEDLEDNADRLDLQKAASLICVPWLILHGNNDIIVPPEEAKQLKSSSGSKFTELKLLDGIGHLYNASTKEEDNYKTLDNVIDITLKWLKGII
jgi:uncharacterized protein